ncbi:MAG: hypothetical protein WC140_04555 [Bacteroidales bacterium]
MKKILLIGLTLLMCLPLSAERYKVKETSHGKMPHWAKSVEENYLIITATGHTLADAQATVLAKLKQAMCESVATNIIAETEFKQSSVNENGVFNKKDEYRNKIHTETTKMSYLSNVTLAKVEDYYWERRQYKKTKKIEYFYAIKYPFTIFELKSLVINYEKLQQKLNNRLEELQNHTKAIESLEEISEKINKVKELQNEFAEKDNRYLQCDLLINNYRRLYEYITIKTKQVKPNQVTVVLEYENTILYSKQIPIVTASWDAAKINVELQGYSVAITYDTKGSYSNDDNYLNIRYKLGNKYVNKRCYLNINK